MSAKRVRYARRDPIASDFVLVWGNPNQVIHSPELLRHVWIDLAELSARRAELNSKTGDARSPYRLRAYVGAPPNSPKGSKDAPSGSQTQANRGDRLRAQNAAASNSESGSPRRPEP